MSFELGGITYTRECFTSLDNDILVMHLTASQPNELIFPVHLHASGKIPVYTSGTLFMEGTLSSGAEDVEGMRYYTRMDIIPSGGGMLSFVNDSIILSGATRATLIISAATNYHYQAMDLSGGTLRTSYK